MKKLLILLVGVFCLVSCMHKPYTAEVVVVTGHGIAMCVGEFECDELYDSVYIDVARQTFGCVDTFRNVYFIVGKRDVIKELKENPWEIISDSSLFKEQILFCKLK